MRKSKIKPLFIGILALLGISLTGKKWRSTKQTQATQNILSGTWTLLSEGNSTKKILFINPLGEMYINSRKIEGSMIYSARDSFHFRDHFGYLLKLSINVEGNSIFYDEADNHTYEAIEKQ